MDKSAQRKLAAQRRARAHEAQGFDAGTNACARLSQHLDAVFGSALVDVVLAGYMPMRTEIAPLQAMRAHPGPVCVPVVIGSHVPLVFHRWTPDMPMVAGRFGADIPATPDPYVPRVLIVPLLAFDPRGHRLGYGGGFYDRTLADLRKQGDVLAIGLAYAAQEQPAVPTEATDEPLDLIVTESGVVLPRS